MRNIAVLSCSRCRMYLSCSESLLRNYLLTSTPFVCLCKFFFLIAKFFFFIGLRSSNSSFIKTRNCFQKVSTTFHYNDDKLCGVTTYYYMSLFFFHSPTGRRWLSNNQCVLSFFSFPSIIRSDNSQYPFHRDWHRLKS